MPPRRDARLHAFLPAQPEAEAKAEAPPARSVSEVVAHVNKLLGAEAGLQETWIRGQVSGFKAAASGHWYFDLKDEGAVLNVAMFRGANARVRFTPEDGMEVLLRGRVAVYPARSTLQVVAEEMRALGQGDLAIAFEQLRRRLEAEGLFAAARKRALPRHPRCVGIVTSLQAAALRDMVRVATARHPGVRVLVAHARVQGEGAAAEVAAALARLDATGACDVIIVGRGGGSIEDLWAFNEEVLVRAVVASRTPVVSAVGHETDVTLCDLAADLRAATPSNAAEIAVPDAGALLADLDDAQARMEAALERLVPEHRQELDELLERAQEAARRLVGHERELLSAHAARLDALSPLATLARGFAVVQRQGKVVRRARDLAEGDDVTIRFTDGAADARVTRKEDP